MAVDPHDRASVPAFARSCRLAVVLIIDAWTDSRKIVNLRQNPCVAVVVGWDDDVSLQLAGVAVITEGAERGSYGREYVAQFPESCALDDGFSVVAIRPT